LPPCGKIPRVIRFSQGGSVRSLARQAKNARAAMLAMVLLGASVSGRAHELQPGELCRRPLRVGIAGNYPPYVFLREKDGRSYVMGLDVDLARRVAQRLCKDSKHPVWFMTVESIDEEVERLKQRDFDMLVGGFLAAEPVEGRRGLFYSHPYLQSQLILARRLGSYGDGVLARAAAASRAGDRDAFMAALKASSVTVRADEGSVEEAILTKDYGLQVVYPSSPGGFDVAAADSFTVPLLWSAEAGWDASVPGYPFAQGGVSIIFRDSDVSLVRAVDRIIDDLSAARPGSSSELSAVVADWSRWDPDPGRRAAQVEDLWTGRAAPVTAANDLALGERARLAWNRAAVELSLPAFRYDAKKGDANYRETDYALDLFASLPLPPHPLKDMITVSRAGVVGSFLRRRYQDSDLAGVQKEDVWTAGGGVELSFPWLTGPLRGLRPSVKLSWGIRRFQDQYVPGDAQPARNSSVVQRLALDVPLVTRSFGDAAFSLKATYERLAQASAALGGLEQTLGLSLCLRYERAM